MKLLPPSNTQKGGQIVKVDKFLPTKNVNIAKKSTNISNKNKPNLILKIEKRVIKIDNLLKDFVSFKKNENKKTRRTTEIDTFKKREEELEKKKPKQEKNKNIIPMKPKLGIFGWITNFITNVVLGFIFVRLIDHLPKLAKLIPIINGVMDGIIDWGGKLLNGLVTFIDWGYSAYDNTVKVFEKFGGKESAKTFQDFIGKFQNVIQYSLIAGMLFSNLAMSSGEEDETYDDFIDERRKPPGQRKPPKPGKPGRPSRPGTPRGPIARLARKTLVGTLGKGGAKTVLKFIKPFTKKLPLIGGLLDFGLSVALGEDPGRAAFKAIGATLLGAVGGALGGPFALLTGLAGGWLGDQAGGALYDAFFKNKKEKKSSSNKQWFDPRGWFGMRNGGVIRRYASGGSTRGGQYQSETPTRQITTRKSKRRVIPKPAKLKQGSATGGIHQLQKVFPEPIDIKSPQGTPSQNKNETMNSFGFLSHSYYRFASVPFIGPLLAMPLKVMMGDTVDSGYYTSIGQGFDSFLNKAYDEGAFTDDFKIEKFDIEKIVSKSVEELAVREMSKIRSDLMQQLMLEKIRIQNGEPSSECPCPEPGGESGGTVAFHGTPEERALLDAISWAEGTFVSGNKEEGYRIFFGRKRLQGPFPTNHPNIVHRSSGYASAAFGRYQFMPGTWAAASRAVGATDMSPVNQDKAALWLAMKRGVTGSDLKGGFTNELMAKLAPEWASFPTLRGGSYYGQPNKSPERIRGVYQRSLGGGAVTALSGGGSTLIASSSPAGSVDDCSCDGDNTPDSNGIDTPTNPGSVGDGKGKKIYLHWAAAPYNANPMGWGYHASFDNNGKKTQIRPYTQRGSHTDKRNTNSIGLTVAAMGGASPSNWGKFPVTNMQINALAAESAGIAKAWGWKSSDITKSNIMTHAEAAKADGYFLGSGDSQERWDFDTIRQGAPSNTGGNELRSMIKSKMGSAGKFGGGPVNKGLTKVHPGEFIIDKDSVDAFGQDFMKVINEVENKSQLKQSKQTLIQMLKEIVPEYSANAPDQIVYNYIPRPSSSGNIIQTANIIQGPSNKSQNSFTDILSIG